MNCKFCETENADDAVFCKHCGKRIDGKRACPSCGNVNEDDAVFCTTCGARLDGKQTCPYCGTLTDGTYCTACGAQLKSGTTVTGETKNVASPRTEHVTKTHNYVELAAGICAMVAVFCALLFTFFIGLSVDLGLLGSVSGDIDSAELFPSGEAPNLWYFFGAGYRDIAEGLASMDSYSVMFEISQYIPVVLGTIIAAATLVTVITFSTLAAVRFGKKTAGKSEKDYFGFAVAAVVCFLLGANLLKVLYNASVSVSYSYLIASSVTASVSIVLNGATTCGIVLSVLCLVGALVCRVVSYGRELKQKERLMTAIFSAVAVVLLGVLFAIAAQGALSISVSEDLTRITFSAAFTVVLPLVTTGADADAATLFSVLTIAQIVQLALLILAGITMIFAMKQLADGKKNPQFALSIATFVLAVVFLVMSIVAKNALCDFTGLSSPFDGNWNYSVPIACVVFGALNLGRAIAQKVLSAPKKTV